MRAFRSMPPFREEEGEGEGEGEERRMGSAVAAVAAAAEALPETRPVRRPLMAASVLVVLPLVFALVLVLVEAAVEGGENVVAAAGRGQGPGQLEGRERRGRWIRRWMWTRIRGLALSSRGFTLPPLLQR